MPNAFDLLLVVTFAVLWPLWGTFVAWPRHVSAVRSGDAKARTRDYKGTVLIEWLLTAAAVTVMVTNQRALSSLWLAVPTGWRAWVGLAVPAAYVALVLIQARAIDNQKALNSLRRKLQPVAALVPHTARDFRWFMLLAVTAGFCEEFLFRGYLVWVLAFWMGVVPAALVSMVVFGLAHGYEGGKFGLRAAMGGVMLGGLALVTRSIIPSMLLHAAMDIGAGWITYTAMSRGEEPKVPNGVAA